MTFSVRCISTSDIYEPVVVLVSAKDLSPTSLSAAVDEWSEILLDAESRVLSNPIFKDRDEWFGFGLEVAGRDIGEWDVFSEAPHERLLEAATVRFLETLIPYNQTTEDGLATHEEMDTGTYALRWLLLMNLCHLPLYLRYLDSIDLEHSVSQLEIIFALAGKYSPAEVEPLIAYARRHEVQVLNDWLDDERAWKAN